MIKAILEAIGSFFEVYGLTILVACVTCICIGCLVELFKQSLFSKLEKRYAADESKLAKLKTVKAGCAFALAALLTAFFLRCIWKSSLPNIGNEALLPIWFTTMYLLQMLCDIKGVKAVFEKILGNVIQTTEPQVEKPKKKKMKKQVTWVEVEG